MIPPTLTLDEAARHDWDAVVVGAGPAGALAARELAHSGATVLLVDKAAFPRWKVCGCCLNGQTLAVLRAVGLGALASGLGAVPLERFRLGSRGRHADLPLAGGVALSREALDAGLIQAAIRAGVAFLPQTQATLGLWEAAARTVALRQAVDSVRVATRLVVAADGLGGRLLSGETDADVVTERGSWIGAGAVAPTAPDAFGPSTIFMACGRGGYVGLVRLEDGRLNVAAAFDPDLLKHRHHPSQAAATILQEAGFPPLPGLPELAWRGTPALTRRATQLAYPRLFVIGDAAGYVQPFTGEGIAWALAAGQAVAALAARGLRQWHPGLEAEWDALYRRTIASRQQTCRAFMRVLSHPMLTTAAVAVLSHWPALAGPVLRRIHQAAPHLQGVPS
jgi:flavin-dependent dehydrogenase